MIDIRYYRAILLRRLPLFVLLVLLISAFSFWLAISLPTMYQSSTRLLVESAQISDNLATSTVNVEANEQLQIIEQRLMTRANLLQIARKFQVYDDLATLSADRIVEDMRQDTDIRLLSGRDLATFMVITFTASTPQKAAGVLNDYITLVLNENSQFRKSRATDTLDFFEQEVERLTRELQSQSSKILVFQADNKDALPSTLDYRLSRQSQLLERVAMNERERLSLSDQKRRMTQLYEATGGAVSREAQMTPDEQELEGLRDQLSQALLVYSQENPKVKLLQTRVDALTAKVEKTQSEQGTAVSRQEAIMNIQFEEIDQQIEMLQNQNAEMQAEIAKLSDTIERTPGNEIALEALQREYSIVEAQYNAAVSRLNTAATGERIEVLSKGERITIVEQPSLPDEPSSPNRPLIAFGGSFMGFMFSAGLIFMLEFLNRSIRRPADLTKHFGIAPLAVLPVVRNPADKLIGGTLTIGAVSAMVLFIPLTLFLIHTYYLPLDLLADRALGKLGI